MEGGRRVRGVSDGDKKEDAWYRTSFHASQYGQSSVDILESRSIEGG